MATIELSTEPLVAGDRILRAEFLRRWEAQPEIRKAELIGGVVYMPSPLSADHSEADSLVICWLKYYAAHTPGCEAGNNGTWFMLQDAPQPDAHLRRVRECGGTSWVEKGFFHGAPELIAETCRSSTSYDLHQKKDLYAAAGVKEYLAVLLHERELRWQRLVGDEYQSLQQSPDGVVRSLIFPGLWLHVRALLSGNMLQVLDTLKQGLESSEHAEFVQQLARK